MVRQTGSSLSINNTSGRISTDKQAYFTHRPYNRLSILNRVSENQTLASCEGYKLLPKATFSKASTNQFAQFLTHILITKPAKSESRLYRNTMTNPKIPSLNSVSRNNQRVDRTLDALVELAQEADTIHRSDREELEKTSQLMLFLGLMAGDSDSRP